jgi:hypothetical protein
MRVRQLTLSLLQLTRLRFVNAIGRAHRALC